MMSSVEGKVCENNAPSNYRDTMNTTSYIMFGATMGFCILANTLGRRMARAVLSRTGKSLWPPAVNSQLAKEYRLLYGADHTYTGYCLFNLSFILGIVIWAFYMAFKG